MGHARNYVSTDISRRILRDYFNYDVFFVQNVTDIDDKIIIRARQNYLFDQYRQDHPSLTEEVKIKIEAAWKSYASKNLADAPSTSVSDFTDWVAAGAVPPADLPIDPKRAMHLSALTSAATALTVTPIGNDSESILQAAKDILTPDLDAELGRSVRDPKLFQDLPAYWEAHFNADMRALNVLPPTVVTRVSEYVPQIVSFVKKMVDNGYAYEAAGSVYFDTVAFEKEGKHFYAKLQPWSRGKTDLIDEGEGSLSIKTVADGKKAPGDFALWKASKPGEPEWQSPWGLGRPGWHIECSVMASEVIGSQMDLHSGGIDLAFPHHDNELAQSEAYHECPQWVNYFLHTGHLHIEGLKMSKSLKNFITIREALDIYSSRQLRLAFALTQWNNPLDFKAGLISEVKTIESTFANFFTVVRALIAEEATFIAKGGRVPERFTEKEKALLLGDLKIAQSAVHKALCDNLATPLALQALAALVGKANVYLSTSKANASVHAVTEVAKWITHILSVFGFESRPDGIGWAEPVQLDSAYSSTAGISEQDVALPYLQVLSRYRDAVRRAAIAKAPYSEILAASDRLRDLDLADLGVVLDDRDGELSALVKFVDRAELSRQRAEKEAKEQEKQERKARAKQDEERKIRERLLKGKTSPPDLFRSSTEFSEFDDDGIPIRDSQGEDIPKSRKKKLMKEMDAQKKLHAEYLKWIESHPGQAL
ncbi:tRNA synthetases class I (C) catalytic domain-containing protein [Lipomyces oligophaga]|uniref:tRNA synthetases class I (C) catalytic domain-containing protein n=1 Tax=Lipomyces oligophaga TaxID=45792 RepID=UPI0034CD0310